MSKTKSEILAKIQEDVNRKMEGRRSEKRESDGAENRLIYIRY